MNSHPVRLGRFSFLFSKNLGMILISILLLFFVFYNLTAYPRPWFDEGSHLHVPKTFVRFGVYADYSSEGFRYYGPTIGVGPTVMLPLALVFKLFGIGLLQARFVMALYLLGAILVFYYLVRNLSDTWLALISCALLVSSRSVLILYYGRQVLGEVPGFLFLIASLALWFAKWESNNIKRLILVGLLFGLAIITKYEYLLFLFPMLGLAWLANIFYYRITAHKNFIIPGVIAGVCFALWQVITIGYLGPTNAMENLSLLRASAEGAAFSFNPAQIGKNLAGLVTPSVYLGALLPALIFGFFTAFPRNRDGQRWGVLYLLMAFNLIWFVFASIGWIRYAFLGLSFASIFIARLFYDATDHLNLNPGEDQAAGRWAGLLNNRVLYRWALVVWLIAIIVIPMGKNALEIVFPGPRAAEAMASYLDANVPKDVIIETWEPEMGFFSDHLYHFPPNNLLALAVKQVYGNGEPVAGYYNYLQTEKPEYLLVGKFSKWVVLYPSEQLSGQYRLVTSIYDYDLYQRNK